MNKLCVVTGATKGIGRAVAEVFAKNGFDLAICARNEAELATTTSELTNNFGIEVLAQSCDVKDLKMLASFAQNILKKWSSIEVLVNNAGSFTPGGILDDEDGSMEDLMQVNFYSAYHLSRHLSNKLNPGGYVFNVSSVAGLAAYPNGGRYSISKFALTGFSKVLREELKEKGVRVSTLFPGAVLTNAWAGTELQEERFMKASDIADIVFSTYQLSPNTVVEEIVLRPQLGDI